MTKKQERLNKPTLGFIPYLFIGFFGIIFAVDITFIYLANKTWTGLYTEDAYQKGLKYNQTLEYVKKQKELGWNSQIKYQQLDNQGNGILNVQITDKNNKAIQKASLIAKFTRPIQEGFDFDLELKFDKKTSSYISQIHFPFKGQWNVEIQAIKGDDIYQKSRRLIIY